MIRWMQVFLYYGVILPAALLCIFPLRKYLKWNLSFRRFLLYSTGFLLLGVTVLSVLDITGVVQENILFWVALLICAAAYGISFHIEQSVLVYVFCLVVCLFSFATLSSYFWDAYRNPTGTSTTVSIEGTFSQWIAMLLFCGILTPIFWKKLEWLIDHYRKTHIWLYMSVPSVIIALCNIMLIPHKFSNMFIGRAFPVALIITFTLLVLFALFQVIFYALAKVTHEFSIGEQKQQLMSMQLHQQEIQHRFIEEAHRTRHNFKQSVISLSMLLKEHKYDEASRYLESFHTLLDAGEKYEDLCSQSALNALLNEYIRKAHSQSIRFHYQVHLPDELNIDEPKLCILVGNLLDNAIQASSKLPEKQRYIKLLLDTEGQTQLYLLIQNSCERNPHWKDDRSTIPKGHYGISSVQAIADEYHGIARFHSEDMDFSAEIMLTLNT